MPTPYPFVSGATLLASQMNSLSQLPTVSITANSTAVATHAYSRVIANGSAITYTIPNSVFEAGQVIEFHNINSTTCTIAAGSGVTVNASAGLTIEQYQAATIYATSASSFIVFESAVRPGLELVRTTTFSAVSSVAEDGVFTSQYANYFLTFEITAASGTNADIVYRYRAGGVDTTTLYVTEFMSQYAGTATFGETATGIIGSVDTLYPVYSQGNAVIQSPQLAQRTIVTSNAGWVSSIGQPRQLRFFSYQDSATQFDGIKLFPSTGTFTGTFRIYGYRN